MDDHEYENSIGLKIALFIFVAFVIAIGACSCVPVEQDGSVNYSSYQDEWEQVSEIYLSQGSYNEIEVVCRSGYTFYSDILFERGDLVHIRKYKGNQIKVLDIRTRTGNKLGDI